MKNIIVALLLITSAIKAQTLTVGPYLQSPTSTSIKVMWRTSFEADSRVIYGTDANNLSGAVTDNAVVNNHTVQLINLQPNTTYYYAVGTSTTLQSGPSALHKFKTPPPIGTVQPFSFWATGDFGKGNSNQVKVRESFVDYTADKGVDFWIWLGDNVYQDGTEQEYMTKVFDSIYGYRDIMKYLPFLPAPGNHDYGVISNPVISTNPTTHDGPYFDFVDVFKNGECGGVASGTELYYSYDYGNAHFLSINSELGSVFNASHDWIGASPFFSFSSSPFTQWLQADLAATDKQWKIVYFHQPPHTDGSHDSDQFWEVNMKAMREVISPILESYGVDLVLCGHSHVYERSYLINDFFGSMGDFNASTHIVNGTSGNDLNGQAYVKYTDGPDANKGAVYMIVGNAGSVDDAPALSHPAMYYAEGCDTCLGSAIVTINGDTLRSQYLTAYGEIQDRFAIIKQQGTGTTTIPSSLVNFNIFPNPVYKEFGIEIELSKESTCTLELFDMQGKLIKNLCDSPTLTKGLHSYRFDAQVLGLKHGVYLIKFADGAKVYNKRLVVD
ncbi:MAG: metallophosphoesterase [Sphingobacteriales bacterium JAD_PAG50586_3]|nr:MAG: metallophosphoesterase [Sphingobacteriales bacterium JAD_PAG50586_3]